MECQIKVFNWEEKGQSWVRFNQKIPRTLFNETPVMKKLNYVRKLKFTGRVLSYTFNLDLLNLYSSSYQEKSKLFLGIVSIRQTRI